MKMEKNDNVFLEIVYNGEKIALDKDKAVTLAQKGMNYDKLYEKAVKLGEELDEARTYKEKIEDIAKELRITPDDVLNGINEERKKADIDEYSKEKNIPYEYARQLKDMEGKIAELEKEKAELTPLKKRNEELSEFKKQYPDVDERNLDPEILKEWQEGNRSLKDIYSEITLKKLLSEKAAQKANDENFNASTGSASGIPEREEEFTDDMIRKMSDKEFNKNFSKILKQYKKMGN